MPTSLIRYSISYLAKVPYLWKLFVPYSILNSFKVQLLLFKKKKYIVTFHYRLLFRCCSAICSISSCLYFSFFLWRSSRFWPPNGNGHTVCKCSTNYTNILDKNTAFQSSQNIKDSRVYNQIVCITTLSLLIKKRF